MIIVPRQLFTILYSPITSLPLLIITPNSAIEAWWSDFSIQMRTLLPLNPVKAAYFHAFTIFAIEQRFPCTIFIIFQLVFGDVGFLFAILMVLKARSVVKSISYHGLSTVGFDIHEVVKSSSFAWSIILLSSAQLELDGCFLAIFDEMIGASSSGSFLSAPFVVPQFTNLF